MVKEEGAFSKGRLFSELGCRLTAGPESGSGSNSPAALRHPELQRRISVSIHSVLFAGKYQSAGRQGSGYLGEMKNGKL